MRYSYHNLCVVHFQQFGCEYFRSHMFGLIFTKLGQNLNLRYMKACVSSKMGQVESKSRLLDQLLEKKTLEAFSSQNLVRVFVCIKA